MKTQGFKFLTFIAIVCVLFSCRTQNGTGGNRNRQNGGPGDRGPGNGPGGPGRGNPGDNTPQIDDQDRAPETRGRAPLAPDQEEDQPGAPRGDVEENPRGNRGAPAGAAHAGRDTRIPGSAFYTEKFLHENVTGRDLRTHMTPNRKKEDLLHLLTTKYPGVERRANLGTTLPLSGRILLFAAMVARKEEILGRVRYYDDGSLRPLGRNVASHSNAPHTQFYRLGDELRNLSYGITQAAPVVIHTEIANTYPGGNEGFADSLFTMAETTLSALYEKFFLNGDLSRRLTAAERDDVLDDKYEELKAKAYGVCLEKTLRDLQEVLFQTDVLMVSGADSFLYNFQNVTATYKRILCKETSRQPWHMRENHIMPKWKDAKFLDAVEQEGLFGKAVAGGVFDRDTVEEWLEEGSLDEDDYEEVQLFCRTQCQINLNRRW